jgi:hypothetical protein
MKTRLYSIVQIFLLLNSLSSCSNIKVITPQSPPPVNEDMISHYFHGLEEVKISQSAYTIEGVFTGLKNNNYVDISKCSYTYTKGSGTTNDGELFKYQTISILFSGKDQQGVETFERLIYSNADLISDFKVWNYKESFGPIQLSESLKFGFDNKNSIMTFNKHSDQAEIIFSHTDMYGTKKSKFFKEGEKRDYHVQLVYDIFNIKKIELSKIIVKVNSSIDLGMGKFSDPANLIQAECSSFKKNKLEED